MTNNKTIVVAYDKNRAIGARGDLPWGRSLPEDMENFKRLTRGGSLIMGRKTFDSLGCHPLPDRENIVVSSAPTGVRGVLTAINLPSAYALARYPIFIIGGGQIYQSTLADADVIFASEIDAEFNTADTFFPALPTGEWRKVNRTRHPADNSNQYSFDLVEYHRT